MFVLVIVVVFGLENFVVFLYFLFVVGKFDFWFWIVVSVCVFFGIGFLGVGIFFGVWSEWFCSGVVFVVVDVRIVVVYVYVIVVIESLLILGNVVYEKWFFIFVRWLLNLI